MKRMSLLQNSRGRDGARPSSVKTGRFPSFLEGHVPTSGESGSWPSLAGVLQEAPKSTRLS